MPLPVRQQHAYVLRARGATAGLRVRGARRAMVIAGARAATATAARARTAANASELRASTSAVVRKDVHIPGLPRKAPSSPGIVTVAPQPPPVPACAAHHAWGILREWLESWWRAREAALEQRWTGLEASLDDRIRRLEGTVKSLERALTYGCAPFQFSEQWAGAENSSTESLAGVSSPKELLGPDSDQDAASETSSPRPRFPSWPNFVQELHQLIDTSVQGMKKLQPHLQECRDGCVSRTRSATDLTPPSPSTDDADGRPRNTDSATSIKEMCQSFGQLLHTLDVLNRAVQQTQQMQEAAQPALPERPQQKQPQPVGVRRSGEGTSDSSEGLSTEEFALAYSVLSEQVTMQLRAGVSEQASDSYMPLTQLRGESPSPSATSSVASLIKPSPQKLTPIFKNGKYDQQQESLSFEDVSACALSLNRSEREQEKAHPPPRSSSDRCVLRSKITSGEKSKMKSTRSEASSSRVTIERRNSKIEAHSLDKLRVSHVAPSPRSELSKKPQSQAINKEHHVGNRSQSMPISMNISNQTRAAQRSKSPLSVMAAAAAAGASADKACKARDRAAELCGRRLTVRAASVRGRRSASRRSRDAPADRVRRSESGSVVTQVGNKLPAVENEEDQPKSIVTSTSTISPLDEDKSSVLDNGVAALTNQDSNQASVSSRTLPAPETEIVENIQKAPPKKWESPRSLPKSVSGNSWSVFAYHFLKCFSKSPCLSHKAERQISFPNEILESPPQEDDVSAEQGFLNEEHIKTINMSDEHAETRSVTHTTIENRRKHEANKENDCTALEQETTMQVKTQQGAPLEDSCANPQNALLQPKNVAVDSPLVPRSTSEIEKPVEAPAIPSLDIWKITPSQQPSNSCVTRMNTASSKCKTNSMKSTCRKKAKTQKHSLFSVNLAKCAEAKHKAAAQPLGRPFAGPSVVARGLRAGTGAALSAAEKCRRNAQPAHSQARARSKSSCAASSTAPKQPVTVLEKMQSTAKINDNRQDSSPLTEQMNMTNTAKINMNPSLEKPPKFKHEVFGRSLTEKFLERIETRRSRKSTTETEPLKPERKAFSSSLKMEFPGVTSESTSQLPGQCCKKDEDIVESEKDVISRDPSSLTFKSQTVDVNQGGEYKNFIVPPPKSTPDVGATLPKNITLPFVTGPTLVNHSDVNKDSQPLAPMQDVNTFHSRMQKTVENQQTFLINRIEEPKLLPNIVKDSTISPTPNTKDECRNKNDDQHIFSKFDPNTESSGNTLTNSKENSPNSKPGERNMLIACVEKIRKLLNNSEESPENIMDFDGKNLYDHDKLNKFAMPLTLRSKCEKCRSMTTTTKEENQTKDFENNGKYLEEVLQPAFGDPKFLCRPLGGSAQSAANGPEAPLSVCSSATSRVTDCSIITGLGESETIDSSRISIRTIRGCKIGLLFSSEIEKWKRKTTKTSFSSQCDSSAFCPVQELLNFPPKSKVSSKSEQSLKESCEKDKNIGEENQGKEDSKKGKKPLAEEIDRKQFGSNSDSSTTPSLPKSVADQGSGGDNKSVPFVVQLMFTPKKEVVQVQVSKNRGIGKEGEAAAQATPARNSSKRSHVNGGIRKVSHAAVGPTAVKKRSVGTVTAGSVARAMGSVAALSRKTTAATDALEASDASSATALHIAAGAGRFLSIRSLLAHGADPFARDAAGWTPLHCAAARGCDKCARELLVAAANKTGELLEAREDVCGRTALHVAATWGRTAVARLLLLAGADPLAHDARGRAPRAPTDAPPSLRYLLAAHARRRAPVHRRTHARSSRRAPPRPPPLL